MKKLSSDKVCQNRLTKYIMEKYGEEKEQYFEYYNDHIEGMYYSFLFHIPKGIVEKYPNGITMALVINRNTLRITESEILKGMK